jgi:hypothetical protein
MALVLGVNKLVTLVKDTGNLRSIIVSEVFFQLICRSIILYFRRLFLEHLSPHQFKVSNPKGCETILFGIKTLLDLHLDWVMMQVDVENAFNNVFKITICRELRDVRGPLANIIPFTMMVYGVCYYLFYQHG